MIRFIKKNWFIILIIIICIIRFFISYKLPNFYIGNLTYDDGLMINQLKSLLTGDYLGIYSKYTLIKGPMFPFFLYFSKILFIPFNVFFTCLYIVACIFFIYSLQKVVNNKIFLIIILILLLFNPVSYSSELFQRLYRNSLSMIELLFFLGCLINVIKDDSESILKYILLGIIVSIMFLTREDNIWIILILILVAIYKLYKHINVHNIIIVCIPFLVLLININILSFVNYVHYNIYTYNELQNSSFKRAYKKILQIKDEKKIDQVAIPKTTFYRLESYSDVFSMNYQDINEKYESLADSNGEINNGNIVWYLRSWLFGKNDFKNGYETNTYFQRLSDEIDDLFKSKKLEKEFISPSIYIYLPTKNELKNLPKNILKAIWYTTSYKDIKTFSEEDIKNLKFYNYDEEIGIHLIYYSDYHNSANIITNNIGYIEIIKTCYKYFTIIFSVIAFVLYIINTLKRNHNMFIIHIIVLMYVIILFGITYTHTTAFDAIRYLYFGNIYILQSLFILLNIYVFINNKKCTNIKKNDIMNL